jgi:hypothetical protein
MFTHPRGERQNGVPGDGHIILADCATAPVNNVGVMKVWTTAHIGPPTAWAGCVSR